jgi:hypothetical protein
MKFSGKIGFNIEGETRPGVWMPSETVEKPFVFEVLPGYSKRWDSSQDSTNDDLKISMRVSIITNKFCEENIGCMRYVKRGNTLLKITEVDPSTYPRFTLTLGGIYHEHDETSGTP